MSDGIATITHVHDGTTRYYAAQSNLEVFVQTKFTDLEQYLAMQAREAIGPKEKTLMGVMLEITEGNIQNVQVYIGTKQRINAVPIWYGPFSIDDDADMIHVHGVEDARYFAIKISDKNAAYVWHVSAMELYGTVGEGRA